MRPDVPILLFIVVYVGRAQTLQVTLNENFNSRFVRSSAALTSLVLHICNRMLSHYLDSPKTSQQGTMLSLLLSLYFR